MVGSLIFAIGFFNNRFLFSLGKKLSDLRKEGSLAKFPVFSGMSRFPAQLHPTGWFSILTNMWAPKEHISG